MSAAVSLREIQDIYAHLERVVPGFKVRSPQLRMMEAVAGAFAHHYTPGEEHRTGRSFAVIEAPTGVGKSMGYALPGIVAARRLGKKLLISSSTVALQSQIAIKDLPLLQKHLPVRFTFAVAKGRGRYICAAKLTDKARSGSQADLCLPGSIEAPDADEARRVAQLLDQLVAGGWSGDRDDLATEVSEDVWAKLTTDRLGCAGSKCPSFAICPFYRARAQVKDADVIVINHDLLLAAAQMPAGSVLPDLGECLLVVDEAHTLAHKAVAQFAARHTLLGRSSGSIASTRQ